MVIVATINVDVGFTMDAEGKELPEAAVLCLARVRGLSMFDQCHDTAKEVVMSGTLPWSAFCSGVGGASGTGSSWGAIGVVALLVACCGDR